ncbi:MAG: DNA-formamidopyrimidine glycosylase family protein [Actinomycetota bacterium]
MPELPELQALSERLSESFGGTRIDRLEPLQFSALKTYAPDPNEVRGKELSSVGRRGKYLVFRFGSHNLLVHLSQGGRVFIEEPPKPSRPKGGVVRLAFDRAAMLVREYGTERKAAWWVLASDDPGPLAALGPEPFDAAFEELILQGGDRRQLHTLLRDQRTVAGIGRGFADDILHAAKLSPFASLASLPADRRESLLSSVREVLGSATEKERSRTGGLPPKLSGRFAIHRRFGEACPRCGATMARVSFESHEITYCPTCQTGGKVLADRRLSRLLR